MATRKRNEWLDAEDSDDDDNRGYDSADESRAKLLSSSKRIKLAHSSDEDSEDEGAHSDNEEPAQLEEDDEYEYADEDQDEIQSKLPAVTNSLLDRPSLKKSKKLLDPSTSKSSKSG